MPSPEMDGVDKAKAAPLPNTIPTSDVEDVEGPSPPPGEPPYQRSSDSGPFGDLYQDEPFSVRSFFPPATWVPRYLRSLRGTTTAADEKWLGTLPNSIKGDMIAGLTVGIMLVPQCLAFALLAGLPVRAGLYSSFLPLVTYALFGTMRQVQTGPTALMCLLTGQALDAMGIMDKEVRMTGAALLALLVGAVSLLLGVCRFGGVVDFMSHNVMNVFSTASGVIIATSQLKDMIGVKIARTHYWWENVESLIHALPDIHWPTTLLSFSLLAILIFLKKWKTAGSAEKRSKHFLWRCMPKDRKSVPFKVLKLVADLSSFGAVVLGSLVAWAMRSGGIEGVRLVGDVKTDGFMMVVPGQGHYKDLLAGSDLFVSAIVISVVGFLETVAVGGKFAAQNRYEFDANQDLLALGLSNIASAVMAGFPVTGGFSRTAVNAAFGATSLLSCALSSTLVVGAMYFLRPLIANIPLCTLAPLIIQGAMSVIDMHEFKVAFRARPGEFVVMLATFGVSLGLTVKEGLLVGFSLSVLRTLHEISRPNLAMVGKVGTNWRDVRHFPQGEQPPKSVVVRMDARLHFTNARRLRDFCLKAISVREKTGDIKVDYVILDLKSVNGIDLSGCEMLHVLAEYLHGRGQAMVLVNLKAPIAACLESAHLVAEIKKLGGHFCLDIDHALSILREPAPNWDEQASQVEALIASAVAHTSYGKPSILRKRGGKHLAQ